MLSKKDNIKFLKKYRPDLTNKQIKQYIDFVYKHNHKDNRKREKHHIIPKYCFKYDETLDENTFDELMNNNFSYLTINNHIKAHSLIGDKQLPGMMSVHRTEEFSKHQIEGTLRNWANTNYRKKMKKVQSNNMQKLNSSEEQQYNKREKLTIECLINIANDYGYINEDLWFEYKVHNTPPYTLLLTKYCYILLQYCKVSYQDLKNECIKISSETSIGNKYNMTSRPYTNDEYQHPKLYMFNRNQKMVYKISKEEIKQIKSLKFE